MRTVEEVKSIVCNILKTAKENDLDLATMVALTSSFGKYRDQAEHLLQSLRDYYNGIPRKVFGDVSMPVIITGITEEKKKVLEKMQELIDDFLMKECP